MIVGTLEIEIFIPWSKSLKDKRSVIRSLQDRIKARFNVSIAEIDYQDKWQRSLIGISLVNSKKRELDIICQKIKQMFQENGDFLIINEENALFVTDDE